jgi:putative peptidoglycan lipid II flippase
MNSTPAPAHARPTQISTAMSVGKASLLLAGMIALSRIAGFGRLVLTSYLYGISPQTDAYNAAFNIPDTINILIAGGALATGFVPVFTNYLAKGDEAGARHTFRAMLTLLGAAAGVLTLALLALTYTPLGRLLAPAKVQPEVIELYLHTLRILLFAQFIFIIGGLFTGVLNALRLFWYPALQPVIFNVGIVVFGIALPKMYGMGIESQAWGALAGALIGSLFIQIPALRRNGLSLLPVWDLKDAGVRQVVGSLLPIVFGLSSGQLIALILPKFFAAKMGGGDITALDNANRLMQVPLAVLASGPAIALYPTLTLLFAEGKTDEFREQISGAVRRTLILMLWASALLMALRFPVVHLLLEHGAFTKAHTKFTSDVLMFYAIGLVGLGAQQFLARGFYAAGDTRAPVVTGIFAMLLFGVLGFAFVSGAVAANMLALAATIALCVLALLMGVMLSRKLRGWDDGATLGVLLKGFVAAAITYVAALYLQRWLGAALSGFDAGSTPAFIKLAARSAVVVGGALFGTLVFVLMAGLLGVQELGPLSKLSQKIFKRDSSRFFKPGKT